MYEYYLVNDSERKSSEWSKEKTWAPKSNIQYESIKLETNDISVELDADGVNWDVWKKVYVYFYYTINKMRPVILTESDAVKSIDLAIKDTSIKPTIKAQFVTYNGQDIMSDEIECQEVIIVSSTLEPKKDVIAELLKNNASSSFEAKEETKSAPPVKKEINLTIKGASIDWEKWYKITVCVLYDDNKNNIHYNENSIAPIKFSEKMHEDKNVILEIEDSNIQPRVIVTYLSLSGNRVSSGEVTVNSDIVELPNDAPPQ